MKLPCIDCIVLAICKYEDSDKHISSFLTSLTNHCSTLKSYLELEDLDIDPKNLDFSLPMSKRKYINVPLSRRILKLYEFMNWDNSRLDRLKILAEGKVPKGDN